MRLSIKPRHKINELRRLCRAHQFVRFMREFTGERAATNYVPQRREGGAYPFYEGDFNATNRSREIIYLSGEISITDLRKSRAAAGSSVR